MSNENMQQVSTEENKIDSSENSTQDTVQSEVPVEKKEPTPTTRPVREHKEYNDGHGYQPVYRDITEKEKKQLGDEVGYRAHPAGSQQEFEGFMEKVIEIDPKDYEKWYPDDRARAFGQTLGLSRYNNIPNAGINMSNDTDKFVNEVKYADKTIGIKKVNFTSAGNGEVVSNAAAIARFTSLLKLGEVMHVPLWNSGFWITITPPQQRDLVNLEIQLTKEELNLGRNTQNFIYSNYTVIYTRIISEFIVKNIKDTTLALPAGENILKYISMSDLYPMVLGMLSCLYPNGLGVNIFCSNNLKMGDNNEPLCQYHAAVMADPIKMLMVDRERLNNAMLEQMSKRLPGSVTVNQVLDYQAKIVSSLNTNTKLENEADVDIEIQFKVPSIEENINLGTKWVSDLIREMESLFTTDLTLDAKDEIINRAADMGILSVYASYIKEIRNADMVVNTPEYITDLLEKFSNDEILVKSFIKRIEEFIYKSAVSIVAVPNFICPTCGAEGNANSKSKYGFDEFIPIEVLRYFFEHVSFRIQTTVNRQLR